MWIAQRDQRLLMISPRFWLLCFSLQIDFNLQSNKKKREKWKKLEKTAANCAMSAWWHVDLTQRNNLNMFRRIILSKNYIKKTWNWALGCIHLLWMIKNACKVRVWCIYAIKTHLQRCPLLRLFLIWTLIQSPSWTLRPW